MFGKKGILKYLLKFTGKHLYWSLFLNEVTRYRSTILLKRDMIIIINFLETYVYGYF